MANVNRVQHTAMCEVFSVWRQGQLPEIRAGLGSGAYPRPNVSTESACGYCSYFERLKTKGQNPDRDRNFRGQKFKKGFIFNVKREGGL